MISRLYSQIWKKVSDDWNPFLPNVCSICGSQTRLLVDLRLLPYGARANSNWREAKMNQNGGEHGVQKCHDVMNAQLLYEEGGKILNW